MADEVTTDDNTVDSSTTEDATTDSSTEEGKEIPFHEQPRFQELISEKNELQGKVEELTSMVKSIKQPVEVEEVPDHLDDPEAFAKYIQDRTIKQWTTEQQAKSDVQKEAEKIINDQFATLKKEHGDIDEDNIGKFAMENGIMMKNGRDFNVIKAYELIQKITDASEEGGKKVLDSVKKGKTPVSSSNSTKEVGNPIMGQKALKEMSWESIFRRTGQE